MIAPQRILTDAPRTVQRVRTATRRRVRRGRRAMHGPLVAVIGFAVVILVPLLVYVSLTANLTSLSFAIARADRERAALTDETQRLDDRIARLTSPDRLAGLALQLKMRDPHVYAVVTLPSTTKVQPKPSGFALLGSWLSGQR